MHYRNIYFTNLVVIEFYILMFFKEHIVSRVEFFSKERDDVKTYRFL